MGVEVKISKITKLIIWIVSILLIIVIGYLVAVYSNIPFIAKWRTIYIETAMGTMSHKWLATSFIPEPVVSDVVTSMEEQEIQNLVDTNTIDIPRHANMILRSPQGLNSEQTALREFTINYSEIDMGTMPENISYNNLFIEDCEGIKTIHGDDVYAIDTINGIVVINIKGEGYVGKLVIVKDPAQVKLAHSTREGCGDFVVNIGKAHDAVVALNASGFMDPEGRGNGGEVVGYEKSFGNHINDRAISGYWFIVGFDNDNNLMIGSKIDTSLLRDGVEFKPALVIDGIKKVEGSAGWGIQPRSAIGQTADKQVLLLAIDGRKPTYSIGATVSDCADIMLRYGAMNAINLDGGSSTALAYNGKTINVTCTSSGNKDGRYVPNAWVVLKRSAIDTGDTQGE